MLRYYYHNKGYFLTNSLGLALGIAVCILLFLFVRQEWTYDSFHRKASSIYRVVVGDQDFDGNRFLTARTPIPLASALHQRFPGIVRTCRLTGSANTEVRYKDSVYRAVYALYTDPSFFEVFSFTLIKGDSTTVLTKRNSVVITKSIANKYFGDADPIGKQLALGDDILTVTGITEDIPQNSSIRFDLLIPFEKQSDRRSRWLIRSTSWNYSSTSTFVELSSPQYASDMEDQFPRFTQTHFPDYLTRSLSLQAITDIHLNQEVQYGLAPTSDPNRPYVLTCTSLLILLISCINFINLAICRTSSRATEVGIRKAFGAKNIELMWRYLSEAVPLSFFSLLIGVLLARLFLPVFNVIAGASLVLDLYSDWSLILALMGLILLVVLIIGVYPAQILTRIDPVNVFKEQVQIGGPSLLVKALIVFQFGVSALLVVCILIMTQQLDYIKTGSLGFNSENVVVIKTPIGARLLDVFRNRVHTYDDVVHMTGASSSFGPDRGLSQVSYDDGSGNKLSAYTYTVDYDYLKTLDIKLTAGRDFSREFGNHQDVACIVNEAAVSAMGWDETIGRKLPQGTTVIGVVEDYYYLSKHEKIAPVVLTLNPMSAEDGFDSIAYIIVRIKGENIPKTLSRLNSTWSEVATETPFEYYFLDDDIDRFYQDESQLEQIFMYSSVFALLIACIGVYGLVSLEVARRTREVGIRKVLGASEFDIFTLLTKQIVYLIVIANVIIWPPAWWIMNDWLGNFAFRTDISAGPFILAGLIVLAIALLTVSYQAIRTALLNPVDAMKPR